jgi:hypothetical protein
MPLDVLAAEALRKIRTRCGRVPEQAPDLVGMAWPGRQHRTQVSQL